MDLPSRVKVRPSLLPSRVADVGATHPCYDSMVTVAIGELKPVATMKWGREATVPLRSSDTQVYSNSKDQLSFYLVRGRKMANNSL
jgi:hypothetical protein